MTILRLALAALCFWCFIGSPNDPTWLRLLYLVGMIGWLLSAYEGKR